ncbi:hypothetical protein B0H67DRAFT_151170 [Lasiosphaeris hirsuta]|uniref:Uncharacterized protein n=1 Tax=Lasiosphaeris hirsuta TaxID=260670 RepID=A0AA40AP34_9PEZI|nr:hypothetical protein B0H67DRAFT_151170 [Lasiosphaeris hirsuta]
MSKLGGIVSVLCPGTCWMYFCRPFRRGMDGRRGALSRHRRSGTAGSWKASDRNFNFAGPNGRRRFFHILAATNEGHGNKPCSAAPMENVWQLLALSFRDILGLRRRSTDRRCDSGMAGGGGGVFFFFLTARGAQYPATRESARAVAPTCSLRLDDVVSRRCLAITCLNLFQNSRLRDDCDDHDDHVRHPFRLLSTLSERALPGATVGFSHAELTESGWMCGGLVKLRPLMIALAGQVAVTCCRI